MPDQNTPWVHTFGITSASDFFSQVVDPYHKAFLANNASSAGALVAITMAYHLYDWADPTETFSAARFGDLYPTKKDMIPYFELAQMLANGFKHFVPTNPAKTSQKRAVTTTEFGFSADFGSPFRKCLNVHVGADKMIGNPHRTADGYISADDLLAKMVEFWRDKYEGQLHDGNP